MKKTVRWATFVLGPALGLAGIAGWWSAREPGRRPLSHQELERAEANATKTDARSSEVFALTGEKGVGRTQKLVELYVRLSGDASATGVRALALTALFGAESLPLRLKGVLDAVNADPTPPREDPLWPKVTQKLAEQWKPDVVDKGRDLMLAEQRPRAKQALVDSFVAFVDSGQADRLTPEQSTALLTDLIDTHGVSTPERKPPIQEAVRKLGGNDPADLLAGKGLGDGHKLELQARYERELEAATQKLENGSTP